ncbi:MAG: DNA methyltransferase [Phycisphaerales bacterium]
MVAARDEATGAAAAALKRLAVGVKEFPNYLTADERVLRQRLRAAARQLGDPWNADKQSFATLNKLTHEVAYEHWHRMLFARFLAENNLLIHPEHGVHVDLATVAELAQEEATKGGGGAKADTWAMAGRFAAAMLPQIFRPDDPALAVQLAPEHQQALEKVLESLPPHAFTADDALGWVYQFWQSAEKSRVDDTVKAGAKITGETLPAVTQLFTEHYMVLFLLHNTVGAWHAGKVLATDAGQRRAAACSTEAELRDVVALPDYSFEYLRFTRDEASPAKWRPAAGVFEGWPKRGKELKVLDPCCGSGHFLVAALEMFIRIRKAEEGLDSKAAALAVIADNLFGLELDARCTQIAAFNVALAAWKLAGEHFVISEFHIACAGLAPSTTEEQWLKLADSAPLHSKGPIKVGLHALYKYFRDAPTLGSLIEAGGISAVGAADYETLRPFLAAALKSENDVDAHERAVAAQGIAKAAEILAGPDGDGRGYTLVITNVPYLGRGGQDEVIKAFADEMYPDAKADLATIFLGRILKWLPEGASFAAVTPQNWLFLATYRKFRERLLASQSLNVIARLGPNAFRDMNWWAATTALVVASKSTADKGHLFCGVDVSADKRQEVKAQRLRGEGLDESGASSDGTVRLLSQAMQRDNPDSMVTLDAPEAGVWLSQHALAYQGISTGDNDRFVAYFWEQGQRDEHWHWLQSGAIPPADFGGRELIVSHQVFGRTSTSTVRGREAWGKEGIAVSQLGRLTPTRFTGEYFANTTPVIVPHDPKDLTALWAFCETGELESALRRLNTKSSVDNGYFGKVKFDADHWRQQASASFPRGLPEPQSDDPTQWLFHGHPAGRGSLTRDKNPHFTTVLQVAVTRLVGYRWPAELDEKMRLAPEARTWVQRCKDLEPHADDDGVVPLVNINKERLGHERVRALLEAAFGAKWTPSLLNDLVAAAGSPGKPLDEWLRGGDFWAQHCSVFHQRPFVWQIWDGKKDGFNILVHYHRLAAGDGQGHKLLTKITYTYLGDWIAQQQAAAKRGEAGADLRLKAAQDLQKKLESILAGDPPYDIFVRWKPLHEQPIGWNPDVNDGVRVNIRPFVTAGVLRGKVNVKWTKDRGKEPESIRPKAQFPWFWSCPEDDPPTDFMGGDKFTGERLNDLHYTRKAKEAARERGGKA